MCLTYLFCIKPRLSKSKDPAKYTAVGVPPMPMRQNSRGEYVREKPWHSGGIKGTEILARAVSDSVVKRSSQIARNR